MEEVEYEQMYRMEDQHWYFAGKRNLVMSLLADHLVKDKPQILDAGCGTGRTLAELDRHYDVVGMEPNGDALSYASNRGMKRLVSGSLDQLPFTNEVFDAVTVLDVLEHCDNDCRAMAEIERVLVSEGLLIVTVPSYQWLWSAHDEALHHRRRYTKTSLLMLLEQNGFIVNKISYFNTFVFPLVAIRRLVSKVLKRDSGTADTDAMPPAFVNSTLYGLQSLERACIGLFNFPFGVSLVCVARKK
jgi:ubiquinone/menaquinone biosynthesis C-methylase UbiE